MHIPYKPILAVNLCISKSFAPVLLWAHCLICFLGVTLRIAGLGSGRLLGLGLLEASEVLHLSAGRNTGGKWNGKEGGIGIE